MSELLVASAFDWAGLEPSSREVEGKQWLYSKLLNTKSEYL